MAQRVAAVGALLGVVAAVPAPAAALPARPAAGDAGHQAVRLACPALDGESRASFEARARAELAAWPEPAGEISVACADGAAVITWWAADGRFRESSVPLAPDAAATVDALLAALQGLRADIGAAHAAERSPAPAPARPPVPIAEPAAAPALRATAAPNSWSRLEAVVGLDGERWQGGIGGALGARLGVRLSARGRWSVTASAGVMRGATTAAGVRAETLQGALAVGYAPLQHLELGLGGELRLLSVVPGGAAGGDEHHDWTEAATATARYVLALGPVRLGVGPRVDLLAHPFIVRVGGSDLFQIPALVAGIFVEGATGLAP